MRQIKLLFLLSCILIVCSCKENIITECNIDNVTNTNITTFQEIQTNIFDQSCALSGCHAESQAQAGLILTQTKSYDLLINVTSILNPSYKRIDPGNSQNSFLIKMLRNTGEGTSQMPPTGKLSDSVIDSIAAWIDRGALND